MIKVLIVDDDKNFVDTLSNTLKEKIPGCEIEFSFTVKDALNKLSLMEKIPDIVISDVAIDDMSGIDFLKLIKSSKKLGNIDVIMVSAKYIEPIDRVEALKNGAVAYFVKHFDIEKIVNEIKYYAQKKK
jgi:DNA-binding response OmpR family regulator